jgi:N6-adenosine-specific RNA methylase IME4
MQEMPLPVGTWDIIYADPPWDYKGQLQHNGMGGRDTGGAIRHYPTLTTRVMMDWDIGSRCAAKNALLFMWATSPHLDQAMDLAKAWGFSWGAVAFVWDKKKTNPGFYTLSQCELCLMMKRGRGIASQGARNVSQWLSVPRERHSVKPEQARMGIDAMFPKQRKIELFARKRVAGWDAWGLDVI